MTQLTTDEVPAPDIVRCAYAELVVSEDFIDAEMAVTIGADGFSYLRAGDVDNGFKVGNRL